MIISPSGIGNEFCPFSFDSRLVSVCSLRTTVIDKPSTGSFDSSVTVRRTISPGRGFDGANTTLKFCISGGSGLGTERVVLVAETRLAAEPLPCCATEITVYSDTGEER